MMPDNSTKALIDRYECDRLLNTWLREFHSASLKKMHGKDGVDIAVGDATLTARFRRYSPSGFHRFEYPAVIQGPTYRKTVESVVELAEILFRDRNDVLPEMRIDVIKRIRESSTSSIEHALARIEQNPELDAIAIEQSLWFGHPFHPLAKSIGGFSTEETNAYAPERSARFPLHWFIVHPSLVADYSLSSAISSDIQNRLLDASYLTAGDVGDYSLFPCHPWQALRLRSNSRLAPFIHSGQIQFKGPEGALAIPTSSVRTVWFPEQQLFVKLPLEARITNFSRVNTPEQIARSIAGTKALRIAGKTIYQLGIGVLDEPVGKIIRSTKDDGDHEHFAQTGYLLRNGEFDGNARPFVVAGLLETNPRTGQANLADLCKGRLSDQNATEEWLVAYISVVLYPLIQLYARAGIVIEAHTQNSLIQFQDDLPAKLFVRDIEGIAVHRETFLRTITQHADGLDPALFYDRETVWRRFLYYVVVNHFAQVIATLAEISKVGEVQLWALARHALGRYSGNSSIKTLLTCDTLPAKANLSSCLGGFSEKPSYVSIPNPFNNQSAFQEIHRAVCRSSTEVKA
ncbi:hypothetical protein H7Q97_13100 [Ochrobactrum sp. CM-21-5]|nr:IucA/IucC family protein [Ochrobactrum sp. CM-21-5]MBC2886329.1 hypothetical protein [Ochrobactrum sp. CM-21-5]